MLLPRRPDTMRAPCLFCSKNRQDGCESQAISTPLLQTFVAKMSFLVRRKKKHGAICKGVLKVGSGEAQKDLNSEAQKNATRSLVRRNSDRILGLHLADFGVLAQRCLWSNLSRKDAKFEILLWTWRVTHFCSVGRLDSRLRLRSPAAAVRRKSEAQK